MFQIYYFINATLYSAHMFFGKWTELACTKHKGLAPIYYFFVMAEKSKYPWKSAYTEYLLYIY